MAHYSIQTNIVPVPLSAVSPGRWQTRTTFDGDRSAGPNSGRGRLSA